MNKDLEIIRKRYVDAMLSAGFDDREKYDEIMAMVIPGTDDDCIRFTNVDYSHTDSDGWPLPGHLRALCDLAVIYVRGEGFDKEYIKSILLKGVNEWIKNDYICWSWWHNEINTTWALSDLCVLIWDILDDEQKKWVNIILGRGSMRYNYDVRLKWSGANLMWGANTSVKHAIFLEDEGYMRDIAARLYREIDFLYEGIQRDGSFFQHGRRQYEGGYGRVFIGESVRLLGVLDGTSFALPDEKRDIFEFHILDGIRWMIHRSMYDWEVCGREFTRHEWGGAGMVAGAIDSYLKLSLPKRREELEKMSDAIKAGEISAEGVHYFPIGRLMCTHVGGIYIGFQGISAETLTNEVCAEEGILCANMSYGTSTCVMNSGMEYYEISPLWNYCRVPGTTTRDESDESLYSHVNDCNTYQRGDRFDGEQLGDCAYSAQTVFHQGINTTVVAFGTPWGVAILGSGIRSDREEKLTTTVEQCYLCGGYKASDDLVVHNGVKYISLDKTAKFVTTAEHRTGDWTRNNIHMPAEQSEGDVFEITLDRENDGYAYLIQPETVNGKFEVLVNTEDVQAIRIPDGRVLAHFFTDGEITVDGEKIIGKAHECIVK